jgi:hypothetical protein
MKNYKLGLFGSTVLAYTFSGCASQQPVTEPVAATKPLLSALVNGNGYEHQRHNFFDASDLLSVFYRATIPPSERDDRIRRDQSEALGEYLTGSNFTADAYLDKPVILPLTDRAGIGVYFPHIPTSDAYLSLELDLTNSGPGEPQVTSARGVQKKFYPSNDSVDQVVMDFIRTGNFWEVDIGECIGGEMGSGGRQRLSRYDARNLTDTAISAYKSSRFFPQLIEEVESEEE